MSNAKVLRQERPMWLDYNELVGENGEVRSLDWGAPARDES